MPEGIVSPAHEHALQILDRLQSGTKDPARARTP
jgi:hypothetical protein